MQKRRIFYTALSCIRTVIMKRPGLESSCGMSDALAPIVTWARANSSVTGMLERLLGEVRKIERRQEIREYIPRTDVLEVRNDS